eukprot:TRINITY_DN5557_c0_g1_i8.p1 TRINITY_DN5557_c0_g1~~TRINITY_DN5557_c0_g1_i8.p1  ORF type:complete len:267 (+),score=-24.58 TRINITY_DN5557_c0_g1_i8:585-1385(+)
MLKNARRAKNAIKFNFCWNLYQNTYTINKIIQQNQQIIVQCPQTEEFLKTILFLLSVQLQNIILYIIVQQHFFQITIHVNGNSDNMLQLNYEYLVQPVNFMIIRQVIQQSYKPYQMLTKQKKLRLFIYLQLLTHSKTKYCEQPRIPLQYQNTTIKDQKRTTAGFYLPQKTYYLSIFIHILNTFQHKIFIIKLQFNQKKYTSLFLYLSNFLLFKKLQMYQIISPQMFDSHLSKSDNQSKNYKFYLQFFSISKFLNLNILNQPEFKIQ